jgi:hypothetical protein
MHLVIKSHFIFINQTKVHTHKTCRWSNCLICYSTHHQQLVGLDDHVFVYLGYYLSPVPHVGRRLTVSRLFRNFLLEEEFFCLCIYCASQLLLTRHSNFWSGTKLGLCKNNGTSSSIYHNYVLSITERVELCAVLYFLSLAVDVDQRGVKSQGLSPYALSPSNQSLCISPDSNARDKLQLFQMWASWVEPGQRATTSRNWLFALQTHSMFKAWYPFLHTYKCSSTDGALMGIKVPSTAPSTKGNSFMS